MKPVRTNDGEIYWKGEPNLSYYREYFETPYIRETQKQFKEITQDMLQKFDVEAYLKKVEHLMVQEGKNADMWLQGDTKEKMEKTFI